MSPRPSEPIYGNQAMIDAQKAAAESIYVNQDTIRRVGPSRKNPVLMKIAARVWVDAQYSTAKAAGKDPSQVLIAFDNDGTILPHTWNRPATELVGYKDNSNMAFLSDVISELNDKKRGDKKMGAAIVSNQWTDPRALVVSDQRGNRQEVNGIGLKDIYRGSKYSNLNELEILGREETQKTYIYPDNSKKSGKKLAITNNDKFKNVDSVIGVDDTAKEIDGYKDPAIEGPSLLSDCSGPDNNRPQDDCMPFWKHDDHEKFDRVKKGEPFGFCPESAILSVIKQGHAIVDQDLIGLCDEFGVEMEGDTNLLEALGNKLAASLNVSPPTKQQIKNCAIACEQLNKANALASKQQNAANKDVGPEVEKMLEIYRAAMVQVEEKRAAPIKGFFKNIRNVITLGGVSRKQSQDAEKLKVEARAKLVESLKVLREDKSYNEESFREGKDENGFNISSPLDKLSVILGGDSEEIVSLRESVFAPKAPVASKPIGGWMKEGSTGATLLNLQKESSTDPNETSTEKPSVSLEPEQLLQQALREKASGSFGVSVSVVNGSENFYIPPTTIESERVTTSVDSIAFDANGRVSLWDKDDIIISNKAMLRKMVDAVNDFKGRDLSANHPFGADMDDDQHHLQNFYDSAIDVSDDNGVIDSLMARNLGEQINAQSPSNRYFKITLNDGNQVVAQVPIIEDSLGVRTMGKINIASAKDALTTDGNLRKSSTVKGDGYKPLEGSKYENQIRVAAAEVAPDNNASHQRAAKLSGVGLGYSRT